MRRMGLRKFGEALPEPNIFVGGTGVVGGRLTEASDWSYSDVQNFVVDADGNVSFFVDPTNNSINAGFGQNVFKNDTLITYFIDLNGIYNLFNFSDEFDNTSNLKHFYAPNVETFFYNTSRSGMDGTAIEHINIEATQTLGMIFMGRDMKVKKLYMPNLVKIAYDKRRSAGMFTDMINLERLYLGNPTDVLNFYNEDEYIFERLKSGCKVYYGSNLGVQDRFAWARIEVNSVQIGDTVTINGLVYTCVASSSVDGDFEFNSNIRTIRNNLRVSIILDSRTGNFGSVRASFIASFSNSLALIQETVGVGGNGNPITTSTSGINLVKPNFTGGNDVHQLLQILRDNDNAVLIEVGTPIAVNAPTSLNYTNLTANSVDLNFTAPTANANGNDGYEVWIDDGTVYRKLFEYQEILGIGDTVDLTEIVNDTNSSGISGSKVKIRTIDGQYNFSPFSNEITLP